jgi:ribose 5-phosphate isomerase RpiB
MKAIHELKIAICSDHAGFDLKQIVNQYLIDKKPVAYQRTQTNSRTFFHGS